MLHIKTVLILLSWSRSKTSLATLSAVIDYARPGNLAAHSSSLHFILIWRRETERNKAFGKLRLLMRVMCVENSVESLSKHCLLNRLLVFDQTLAELSKINWRFAKKFHRVNRVPRHFWAESDKRFIWSKDIVELLAVCRYSSRSIAV